MATSAPQLTMQFSYKPQGPVIDAYLRDRGQRAFIMGPLGSSKTNASCWKAFKVMCDQEPDREGVLRTRLVAIRNTYSDLLSTTAKDWLEMFEPLGRYVAGGREPPQHSLDFMLPPEVPGAPGPKGKPTRVLAEMVFLALDREDHPGEELPIPKVQGGDRRSVVIEPTPAQSAFLGQIIEGFNGLPNIQDPY